MSADENARYSAFVQDNSGKIFNSYVDMEFIGSVRGLFVGENRIESAQAKISNSYIIGDAKQTTSTSDFGFTAVNRRTIENVYYAVESKPNSSEGAITDSNDKDYGVIRNSYFDRNKWRGTNAVSPDSGSISNSAGFNTIELQMPTVPNTANTAKPYYQWSKDNWNFGNEKKYPSVKYASGDDNDNPACGISQQPLCGILLRGQNNQPAITSPTSGTQVIKRGELGEIEIRVSDTDINDTLKLIPTVVDENQAAITITADSVEILPSGTSERTAKLKIRVLSTSTQGAMIELRVIAEDDSDSRSEPISLNIIAGELGANTTPTIIASSTNIEVVAGETITLDVEVMDDNGDPLSITLSSSNNTTAIATILATNGATRTLEISGLREGVVDIEMAVDDGRGEPNSRTAITFSVKVITGIRIRSKVFLEGPLR